MNQAFACILALSVSDHCLYFIFVQSVCVFLYTVAKTWVTLILFILALFWIFLACAWPCTLYGPRLGGMRVSPSLLPVKSSKISQALILRTACPTEELHVSNLCHSHEPAIPITQYRTKYKAKRKSLSTASHNSTTPEFLPRPYSPFGHLVPVCLSGAPKVKHFFMGNHVCLLKFVMLWKNSKKKMSCAMKNYISIMKMKCCHKKHT